jgi:hypothetical protein
LDSVLLFVVVVIIILFYSLRWQSKSVGKKDSDLFFADVGGRSEETIQIGGMTSLTRDGHDAVRELSLLRTQKRTIVPVA